MRAKELLTNRWTGRSGATVGLGSVLGLLATEPPAEPALPPEPPAIVESAVPQPEPLPVIEDFYPAAMPQPKKVEVERIVTETERVDTRGKPIIHRTFEPVGEEIDTESFATDVEAWALQTIREARERFESYQAKVETSVAEWQGRVIEFVRDPVFVETTQDVQQLRENVDDSVAIIRRIVDRAEGDPWLVLGALLGNLIALFAEPKKQPKGKNDEKTD